MADKQALIDQIAPYAMQSQQITGIPASVTIAQFIQESGWTLSTLATKFNNFFGVKSGGDPQNTAWLPTQEYDSKTQTYSTRTEPFKVYGDPLESFADHAKVLNRLGISGGDPYAIADKLQANGYATDPQYASKLKNLIDGNNLTFYDTMAATAPKTEHWYGKEKGFLEGIMSSFSSLGSAAKGTITGNPNPDLAIIPNSDGKIGVKNPTTGEVEKIGDNPFKGFDASTVAFIGIIILIIAVIIFGAFATVKGA